MARHTHIPSIYHATLGPHEPALTVDPGDTIVTKTLDAAGADERGEKVGPGGNPQTGPFAVRGAEPGDTLVVRLDRLSPNRAKGWSYVSLQQNVVDPGFVRELPQWGTMEWKIDGETATVLGGPPELADVKLPLSPFPGAFGVAPARGQAITAITSGDHGGNMDYRSFTVGTTVYFPVFAAGALFFIGDGHAVQSEGEIAGSAVEVSFSVEFTLDLIKGKTIGRPRGENETHIFAVGNARPLDQAMQHATTEMLRWLETDYALSRLGATILMGQCAEYDVANFVDPAYTMVCKMQKSMLERFRKR